MVESGPSLLVSLWMEEGAVPRTAAIRLRDRVAKEVMLRVANWMRHLRQGEPSPGFVTGPEDLEIEEPEMELFMDWDAVRGDGRGAYSQDDDECRSRRVDLRGPTDRDPGPLPMEEARGDTSATHLLLNHPPFHG